MRRMTLGLLVRRHALHNHSLHIFMLFCSLGGVGSEITSSLTGLGFTQLISSPFSQEMYRWPRRAKLTRLNALW